MKVLKKVIFGLCLLGCTLPTFSCNKSVNENDHSMWIVDTHFNQNKTGKHGKLYLDISTYNFYQYQHHSWQFIDNISDQVEMDVEPVITSENGYWSINNVVTPYMSYDENSILEYLTEEDYVSQVAMYGSCNNVVTKTRMRIVFSKKMKKGTCISFIGDTSMYKFGVGEMENTSDNSYGYVDGGWIDEYKYITTTDNYPVPTIMRQDGKSLSNEELLSIHSMIKVRGVKESLPASEEITEEEYLNQVSHFGSYPNPTTKTRLRISFAIRTEKGTQVTFLGNQEKYKWAVVETFDTSTGTGYLDLGWSNTWTGDRTKYKTYLDGAYIVITLSTISNENLTVNDLNNAHSLFLVEGKKKIGETNISQHNDIIGSTAHRGFSYRAPENTLSAYRLAKKYGFTQVECDIQFTSDNVPVLLHDDTIDRTSNGTGDINEISFEKVREFDFGSWKTKEYRGEKIPTFEEFIVLCKELNLHPYIEIKASLNDARAEMLVATVNKYEYLDNVTWISFGADSLSKISKYDESSRLGYVVSSITENTISQALNLLNGKDEVFINVKHSNATDAAVDLCKNNGFALEVWTVDSVDTMLKLNPYITGITSNWIQASSILKELGKDSL